MIDTLYIEEEIRNHPRVKEICERFRKARLILCERYGEVFNPRAQNFRLQKLNPALILAKKFGTFLLETPAGYGIGGNRNFYFSHMLNCIYDCRYCFLAGMFLSAHYVLFINYEDFQGAIERKIKEHPGESIYFFSGYDCDSLALDSITRFVPSFLPFFGRYPNAYLELRTKSIHIESLLKQELIPNGIVAFSLTPPEIQRALEHKTPSVEKRLETMVRLAGHGWKLGLRFDPIIYHVDYKARYRKLFRDIFEKIPAERLHSVSLGPFRLPKRIYERMERLYPEEKLFHHPLREKNGMITYQTNIEQEMSHFLTTELLNHIPKKILFSYPNRDGSNVLGRTVPDKLL